MRVSASVSLCVSVSVSVSVSVCVCASVNVAVFLRLYCFDEFAAAMSDMHMNLTEAVSTDGNALLHV